MRPQTAFVSATPGKWELEQTGGVFVEQVIRPTGLIDPPVEDASGKNPGRRPYRRMPGSDSGGLSGAGHDVDEAHGWKISPNTRMSRGSRCATCTPM